MKINEDSLLVIEEGEDLNIRFEKNHHVSAKPQIAERILVIHAPPSKDVNQALRFARDAGRSSHLIIGHDGKEIVQTVPFNVDHGNKRKKKNQPPRLKTKINGNQQFYRTGGGQPTPPVPGGPFPAGTRVRKQEENGKWTLVVVQDYIKDETGFEGWVNAGLVSGKPIPKSNRSILGALPGLPLWQHKDDHELGKERPHPGDPAVYLFEESEAARVDLTKEWQFFIRAINYKMPPDKVSAIFGNLRAFCNHTGLGDAAHPRADFIKGENLLSPLPQLDKVRTCALSVMTGVVEGEHLVVEMMNGSQPPPLKPGRVQPQRIEEIDPDAYLFTPWSDRHLFFAANRSVRGGRETKPFPNGALYDYTLDGRPYTWLPYVKPAGLKVRYPLSRLHRLPPNSEIPSPYKS